MTVIVTKRETFNESENNATNKKGTENQENEGDDMESCSDVSLDKDSYSDQEETFNESAEKNATNKKGTENQENEGDRMESCSDESLDKDSYSDQEGNI